MKNLIIIIILLFIEISINSQMIKFAGINMQEDKLQHFSVGFIEGNVINISIYKLLSLTKLDPELSKMFSTAFAIFLTGITGHTKERYDKKNGGIYNKEDFKATLYGGIIGSFTVRLFLWNSIPENHLPEDAIIYSLDNTIFIRRK